jgi:hypothetical protein
VVSRIWRFVFSIISILPGAVTLYDYGLEMGGPRKMSMVSHRAQKKRPIGAMGHINKAMWTPDRYGRPLNIIAPSLEH